MWRNCEDRAYPFKHHHANFFPPPPKSSDSSNCEEVSIVFFGQNQELESKVRTRNYPLTTPKTPPPFILFEPSGGTNPQLFFVPEDEEEMSPKTPTPAPLRPRIPLVRSVTEKNFQPPPAFTLPPPQERKILRNAAKSPQRPSTPPNTTKKPNLLRIQTGPAPPTTTLRIPPPTPAALAPIHLTGLLQEVLSIMDTIMSQQTIVQEEEEVLRDLTELVVILQDEAEALVNMAGLVEEYVDEIATEEQAAELQVWVSDLELDSLGTITSPTNNNHEDGRGSDRKKGCVRQPTPRIRHEREDSGIGLDPESEIDPQRNFQIVVPYQPPNNINNIPTPTKAILSPTIFTPPHKIQQQQQASPSLSSQKKAPSYARPTVSSQKNPSKTKSNNSPQPFRDSGLDILSPVGASPSLSGRSSRSTRRPYGRWM